ncbi:MAG: (2Fe-2S)-binding protein, partial [Frankia sp.]
PDILHERGYPHPGSPSRTFRAGCAGSVGPMAAESTPIDGPRVARALAAAGDIGPFFAVTHSPKGPGWVPLGDLVSDAAVLVARVEAARAVIARSARQQPASVDPRIAASIVFLGIAARLVSPPLAAAVLTGVIPRWTLDGLSVQPVTGGPWPLAAEASPGYFVHDLRSPGPWEAAGLPEGVDPWEAATPWEPAGLREAADLLTATVIADVVGPVLGAVEEQFRVSRKILTGNVASGIAGAIGLLAVARPERARLGYALAENLLVRGILRDSGVFSRPSTSPGRGPAFVRRSCCLFYRIPGAGTCGDCILTAPAASRNVAR